MSNTIQPTSPEHVLATTGGSQKVPHNELSTPPSSARPSDLEANVTEQASVTRAPEKDKPTENHNPPSKLEHLHGFALIVVMIALNLSCILIALDMSIVSTAIPRITNDFNTLADIGWYGSAYLLTCACVQPLTGKIYTYFSLKLAFLAFVFVFEVGSVIAGAAATSEMLVVGRAISGLGGAGIMSGCLTIIGVAAAETQRPMLMAITMAVFGIGQTAGPLIGGALTEHASWRWCFYLNLPVGAVSCIFLLCVRLHGQQRQPITWKAGFIIRRFDLVGFVFFAAASLMILLALQWGGNEYAWSSSTTIGLICGSGATFAVFAYWERRAAEHAMIPLAMITQRVLASAVLTSGLQGAGLILLSYYLPLYFQVVRRVSPVASAVRVLPTLIAQVVFAIISGTFVTKVGYLMPPVILGSILATIGAGLLTTLDVDTPASEWIGYQVLAGAGRGLAIQIPVLVVQNTMNAKHLPIGTAIVTWSQFFGGAVFLGLGQAALQNLLRTSLPQYAPAVRPELVLQAGATSYQSFVPESEWPNVARAYAWAIGRTFALAVAAAGTAFFTSLGIGWRLKAKTKKDKKRLENARQEKS